MPPKAKKPSSQPKKPPPRSNKPSKKADEEAKTREAVAKAKEDEEQSRRPRKRRSSTLDRGEQIQVTETPSRLRIHGPKETPHGPKETQPKQTPLKLNGPRREPVVLNFSALKRTQGTDDSRPPPTPPATFSSLADQEWPRIQPKETPKAPISNFRRLLAAQALREMNATPTPSQWFNSEATMTSNHDTQDYFTGTQPEREERSQIDCFEGVIGEANRPWTQDQVENEEDDNDAETIVESVVSKKTVPTQRSKASTSVEGGKNARTQSLAPADIDSFNDSVAIQYKLLTRCFFEGKSIKQGRHNPTIIGNLGSAISIDMLATEQQQEAKRYADSQGLACQRVSMRVVATHERTTAKQRLDGEIDVEETQSFWTQLEDDIKEWYELKRKDLTITLTSHWGRRSDGVIPPSAVSSQNETSSSTNRPKTTSTVKLRAEMDEYRARQSPAQELNQELLLKWRCLKVGCNEGHHCYVDGKNEHFPMNPAHTIYWAREIDSEGSSITQEKPSSKLLGMLTSEKRQQRKQAKKAQSEQPQPTPAAVVPSAITAPGPTINYYIGRGPDDRQELPRQRSTSRYISATPHPLLAASPPPPPPPNPPSSPARGDYTLKDYIDWHIKRQPNRKEQFLNAYNRLDEECYAIHYIQKLKDTMDPKIAGVWRSLDIPLGLGRQLAEDASRFAREYEQGRAGSPALPIRDSPRKHGTWQHPAQPRQSLRPVLESIECDLGSPTEDEESQDYQGYDMGGEDLDDSQVFLQEKDRE